MCIRDRQGEPARISAKMNSLQDVEIIDALYRAAAVSYTHLDVYKRQVVTADGKPSAHFEHTVIVKDGAPLIVTDRPRIALPDQLGIAPL